MKRLKSLFSKVSVNGLLIASLVVTCGSYFAYAGSNPYDPYSDDDVGSDYNFDIVKNVTGDVTDDIPTDFDFFVTAVSDETESALDSEDASKDPNTHVVTVDSTNSDGTTVSVNANRINVKENLEAIDGYAVDTDYYLSQTKDAVAAVQGYYRYSEYDEGVQSTVFCNVDLEKSNIAVELNLDDEAHMNPNLPYYVDVSRCNDDGTVSDSDARRYELRTNDPKLVVSDLEPGRYAVQVATEGFYSINEHDSVIWCHADSEYDYKKCKAFVSADKSGSFEIYKIFSGVDNYEIYDASGTLVHEASADYDYYDAVAITGLNPFEQYTVLSNSSFKIECRTYESVDAVHGELSIRSNNKGELFITRTNGHHGVTKYSVYDSDDNEVSVFSIGEDTEDQTHVVSGLSPEASYRIVSDDMCGQMTASVRSTNEGFIDESYIMTLEEGVDTKLTVTNDYKDLIERGDLIIRKYVYGTHSNKADRFDFRLSLFRDRQLTSECDGNAKRYGLDFDNGVCAFSLFDDEYAMATKIPVGVSYILEEYDATAHDYMTVVDGMEGVFSTTLSEAISISTRDRGSYKYVHEYYAEYPDGNRVLEGTSDIGSSATDLLVNDMAHYTVDDVEKQPVFTPEGGKEYTYDYTDCSYGDVSDTGYSADEAKEFVIATESGEQIIILRYVRKVPEIVTGSYKYVHEYYFEDLEGNRTLEGTSDIRSSADDLVVDDDISYTADQIVKEHTFTGLDGTAHTYVYDVDAYGVMDDAAYHPVDDMSYVVATETGSQIIILRYVRYQKPEAPEVKGSYKFVHEYYTEDSNGNRELDGISDIMSSNLDLMIDDTVQYTVADVEKQPVYNDAVYTYDSVAYGGVSDNEYSADEGMSYVVATEDGDQIIILKYVKRKPDVPEPKGFYRYVHEYYTEDLDGNRMLDGTSDVMCSDKDLELDDNIVYTTNDVGRQFIYNGHTYVYDNGGYGKSISDGYDYEAVDGMDGVVATENGEWVIILRYVRTPSVSVDGSYKYVHEYYTEDIDGNLIFDGKSDIVSSEKLEVNDEVHYTDANVEKQPVYQNRDYEYTSSAYGTVSDNEYAEDLNMSYVVATEDGNQIIILKYIRKENRKGFYRVVHEYYVEDNNGDRALEGISGLLPSSEVDLDDNIHYTVDGVGKIPQFTVGDVTYTYEYTSGGYGTVAGDDYIMDSDMEYVVATRDGDEVIILQYVRRLTSHVPDVPKEDLFGTLIINKTVTGDLGDKKQDFEFVLTLDDTSINGEYDDFVFENGKAVFTLHHGESKRVVLPEGIGYTVTEKSVKDYKMSVKNDSGVITGDKAIVVRFVNKCTKKPSTTPKEEDPGDTPGGNKPPISDRKPTVTPTPTPSSTNKSYSGGTGGGTSGKTGSSGSGGTTYIGNNDTPLASRTFSNTSRVAESVRTSDSSAVDQYLIVILCGILSVCGFVVLRKFRRK